MKILTGNTIIKKIILVLLVIIMLNNFIMPNYVRAEDSIVVKLIKGFFGLLVSLADAILQTMQAMMIGPWDIGEGSHYEILYSPGIIFSNHVAALKVDFIGQTEEYTIIEYDPLSPQNSAQMDNLIDNKGDPEKIKTFNVTDAMRVLDAVLDDVCDVTEPYDWPDEVAERFDAYNGAVRDKAQFFQWFFAYWESYIPDSSIYFSEDDGSAAYAGYMAFAQAGYNLEDVMQGNDAFKAQFKEKHSEIPSNDDLNVNACLGHYRNLCIYPLAWHAVESSIYVYDNAAHVHPEKRGSISYVSDVNSDYGSRGMYCVWNGELWRFWLQLHQGTWSNWYTVDVYKYPNLDVTGITNRYEKENTDYILRPIVSKWYSALRTMALVGLLSVLVYIGIRIILSSSSAQDKAKFKNMLKEWLVAVCILFMLHYVMAFMLQFNQALNDVFIGAAIEVGEHGEYIDPLLSSMRSNIGDMENITAGKAAGYTLMWLVVVILTATFTFQYLKRVVYMAFLTMIAPLIALTYPLDKIKDGKAQAFSFWIKEYVFQCLIQPVHLLLYSMLISSALELAEKNMLYAIITLAFLVPAEKLIKQMFGMESKTSSGNFSAAMGGAAVMSMMNKLKGVGPKRKEEGEQGSAGKTDLRTSNNRTGGTVPTSSTSTAPLEQPAQEAGGGAAPRTAGGSPEPVVGDGAAPPVGNSTATTSQWEEFDRANERSRPASSTVASSTTASSSGPSLLNKFGRVLRGSGNIIGRAIAGPKGIKYRGRKLTGKALGLLGGAVGAAWGVAAAIASGDESKILPNMAGGFIAGDAVGERMSEEGYKLKDKVTNGASDYKDAFKSGYISRDLETFKAEMIGKEFGGIRITEDNVEEIFNRIQELRKNSTEL